MVQLIISVKRQNKGERSRQVDQKHSFDMRWNVPWVSSIVDARWHLNETGFRVDAEIS